MIKKRKKPVISPVGDFQNPFGNEVVQMEEVTETNAMTDENGDQLWVRRVSCAPPIFGRN
ncbi:hypothetical protein ACQCVB_01445 [Fictibacillus phosphorivorans]|uniref:hypothetical protein n=1 Tax=Fictibacillus TaxID=1329200 RepID=UPI0018CE32A2|nr:hypothetical protein [Fictibacillus sp. 23RED33]MBH0175601.1 hypothetical protein [Fictibacillus sp. 23RED33]